nr:basic proline-rich protein-like [Meriones unguiculatus]
MTETSEPQEGAPSTSPPRPSRDPSPLTFQRPPPPKPGHAQPHTPRSSAVPPQDLPVRPGPQPSLTELPHGGRGASDPGSAPRASPGLGPATGRRWRAAQGHPPAPLPRAAARALTAPRGARSPSRLSPGRECARPGGAGRGGCGERARRAADPAARAGSLAPGRWPRRGAGRKREAAGVGAGVPPQPPLRGRPGLPGGSGSRAAPPALPRRPAPRAPGRAPAPLPAPPHPRRPRRPTPRPPPPLRALSAGASCSSLPRAAHLAALRPREAAALPRARSPGLPAPALPRRLPGGGGPSPRTEEWCGSAEDVGPGRAPGAPGPRAGGLAASSAARDAGPQPPHGRGAQDHPGRHGPPEEGGGEGAVRAKVRTVLRPLPAPRPAAAGAPGPAAPSRRGPRGCGVAAGRGGGVCVARAGAGPAGWRRARELRSSPRPGSPRGPPALRGWGRARAARAPSPFPPPPRGAGAGGAESNMAVHRCSRLDPLAAPGLGAAGPLPAPAGPARELPRGPRGGRRRRGASRGRSRVGVRPPPSSGPSPSAAPAPRAPPLFLFATSNRARPGAAPRPPPCASPSCAAPAPAPRAGLLPTAGGVLVAAGFAPEAVRLQHRELSSRVSATLPQQRFAPARCLEMS